MKVNADAEGFEPMRQRIRDLEAALRPFVVAQHYQSGVDSRTGERWCSPRVPLAAMDAARVALAGAPPAAAVPRMQGMVP